MLLRRVRAGQSAMRQRRFTLRRKEEARHRESRGRWFKSLSSRVCPTSTQTAGHGGSLRPPEPHLAFILNTSVNGPAQRTQQLSRALASFLLDSKVSINRPETLSSAVKDR